MQVRDLSHPKNSKALNESAAKTFGYKINIDQFTMEELQRARDSLVEKIATYEKQNSYDAVFENNAYHKNRMFLDIITQAITERTLSPGEEKKREKFVKGMKKASGDFEKRYGKRGKDVMYATATKMAKAESVKEAAMILHNVLNERVLNEGEEERAALIMSSRDMVDKITGWLEDVASLKAETLLELIDSIRDELGAEVAGSFEAKVKPSLEEIYGCLEANRQTLAQAVAILTGEEAPGSAPIGATAPPEISPSAMPQAGSEPAEELPVPADLEPRAKRESVEYSRRLGTILSSKKK